MLSSVSRNAPLLCKLGAQWARACLGLHEQLALHQRHATTAVARDPSYSRVSEDDIEFFKSVLGDRGVVEDETALEPMNRCAKACIHATLYATLYIKHQPQQLRTSQLYCNPYLARRDWMGKYVGRSKLALKPNTTEEVSQVLAYCSRRRLALVPQGGNTGLVGGSVPVFDEIVLNMSSLNKIVSFDEVCMGFMCARAWPWPVK